MSRDDGERWEVRWRERPPSPADPEPFLVRHHGWLRPGHVLDVACGAGRNALWLARRGFAVTAIDIAPSALARLEEAARREQLGLVLRQADLDDPDALSGLGPFDDLVVIRYNPSDAQWARLLVRLRPGGRILLCGFALADHFRHGTRRAYCLEPERVEAALAGMRLLVHETFDDRGRALAGFVWEKAEG